MDTTYEPLTVEELEAAKALYAAGRIDELEGRTLVLFRAYIGQVEVESVTPLMWEKYERLKARFDLHMESVGAGMCVLDGVCAC